MCHVTLAGSFVFRNKVLFLACGVSTFQARLLNLTVGPSERKCKSAFDKTICTFAQECHKTVGLTPDVSKLDSLFWECRERLDVAKQIFEHEQQILHGTVIFSLSQKL